MKRVRRKAGLGYIEKERAWLPTWKGSWDGAWHSFATRPDGCTYGIKGAGKVWWVWLARPGAPEWEKLREFQTLSSAKEFPTHDWARHLASPEI